MKTAYPVILTKTSDGYISFVPDLNINSQGKDIVEVIEMTRDAIEMWCCFGEDEGRSFAEPSLEITCEPNQIKTLIDINLEEYRKANDNRAVKKTLTIPSWLNVKAERANINFSRTLQEALKKQLNI